MSHAQYTWSSFIISLPSPLWPILNFCSFFLMGYWENEGQKKTDYFFSHVFFTKKEIETLSFWSINFNPDYVKQGFSISCNHSLEICFLNANSFTKLWRGPMIVGSFISIYRKCFDPSVPFKRLKTSNVTKFVDFWCVWQEDAPKWYLQRIYDCSFGIQETIWSQL